MWGSSTDEIEEAIVTDLDRDDAAAAAGRLATAVTARPRATSLADAVVANVADEIFRTRGTRPISSIASEAAVSERQLRRRCTTAVGYAPKTLARIARFQVALGLLQGGAHPLVEVAHLAGYADQAHLTREVVALSGRPPRAHLPVPG